MGRTTVGNSWIGGMLFALLLFVGGFANAASLLLERDCYSLELPGSRQYRPIGDGLRYWCLRLGLWAPVSFHLSYGRSAWLSSWPSGANAGDGTSLEADRSSSERR